MKELPDRPARRAVHPFLSLWSPTAATMRLWALAAVAVNAGITVTGAVVRVTGSGLGCPTWPRCTPDSFVPAAHDGISPLNTAIEFGNRLLTFLVLVVAVACVIAARRLPEHRSGLVRLAWIQPFGVAVQAFWGGVVVHSALNPVTVNVHFLFSVGMMAAACLLYARAGEGDAPPEPLVHPRIRTLGSVLVGAVLTLIVAGMVVTGTGPHSGDELASRFPFDIETVARIHADAAYLVVGLTFALTFALHVTGASGPARRAALTLLAVELAQGVVGYVQYFLAVPAFLVGLHVLGSTLVWICTLRVVFALRSRGPADAPAAAPAGASAPDAVRA
ncbi:cytochrome b561 [Planomonospora parontospora subsp. parontospora]|uniref:Cytochrome b561 n=2 Tax=Planomonospora parontospora TaxID=58119 RepID=A0AA37BG01_9ACTN|nr:COX15/CtaA family protein [Planomonospora parontospora]GGK66077.1 cytochrome b561 [Planomonospora parontospora]GII08441.1 cytochrome b561 [Planomonospora parontospora subsp. parontospora]